MGLQQFQDGNSFASGVLSYAYRPINSQETTYRIIIPIEIGNGIKIEAVLDTGAPYVILDPNLTPLAGFTPELVLSEESMLIRGVKLSGKNMEKCGKTINRRSYQGKIKKEKGKNGWWYLSRFSWSIINSSV